MPPNCLRPTLWGDELSPSQLGASELPLPEHRADEAISPTHRLYSGDASDHPELIILRSLKLPSSLSPSQARVAELSPSNPGDAGFDAEFYKLTSPVIGRKPVGDINKYIHTALSVSARSHRVLSVQPGATEPLLSKHGAVELPQ